MDDSSAHWGPRHLVPGLVAMALLAPLLVWLQTVEGIGEYLQYSLPPGQFAYVLSRLFGLYALSFLSLQILVGLQLPRQKQYQLHAYLGLTSWVAIALHSALYIGAVSVRSGHLAIGILIPKLSVGYYEFAVSLGVLGLWGVLLIVLAGICRVLHFQAWKWVHYLAIPIFGVIFVHGLLIGTDTRMFLGTLFYLFIAIILLCGVFSRFRGSSHQFEPIPSSSENDRI